MALDLRCFACGEQVDVQTVHAVTSYQDLLITYFAFEGKKQMSRQEIRFYKISQNQSLIVDSQITNLPEIPSGTFDSFWAEAPRLFAFECFEVQKPLLVVALGNNLQVRDFDGTLLAEDHLSIKSRRGYFFGNGEIKNRFIVWNQNLLVDAIQGILQLEIAADHDFTPDQKILPYKIKWNRQIFASTDRTPIFNAADQFIVAIQYPRFNSFTSPSKICFDIWDKEALTPCFRDAKIELTKHGVAEALTGRKTLSVYCMQNKIITITKKLSGFGETNLKKKAFVWSMDGKYEREFSLGEGSVFAWNNMIAHIASDRARINEVTFWNLHGEIVGTYEMDIPAFYVWNQNLVVFNDCIEVFRSML